jgi:hypothetical protein
MLDSATWVVYRRDAFLTNACHDQMDNDCGKVLLKHMSRTLTGHHPAHFLISWSPCSKDRSGPEEGGGRGWLAKGLACHPCLGSFIVQKVIEGEKLADFQKGWRISRKVADFQKSWRIWAKLALGEF